jgi:hypothetical protein
MNHGDVPESPLPEPEGSAAHPERASNFPPAEEPRAPAPSGSEARGEAPALKEPLAVKAKRWVRKGLIAIVGVAVLIVVYFILSALVPREWAGFIGRQVNGRLTSGILTGLTVGALCTFVPIVCFALAVVNHGRLRNVLSWLFGVLGVVTAIPNLLTLTVVLGSGSGAHAGERILDVEAGGFRGASLAGAIVGAVIAAVAVFYIVRYRMRGKKLRAAKE